MPFFLSLFITDAAIIIKCGHTLGEWDAFEEVKVIGCSEGAATAMKPRKHHGQDPAQWSFAFPRLSKKPQSMIS
jgi:hypothetical protein